MRFGTILLPHPLGAERATSDGVEGKRKEKEEKNRVNVKGGGRLNSFPYCKILHTLFGVLSLLRVMSLYVLQGVSIALLCKSCTSYDRQVVRLSVCLSVRHTLALSENDAS